MDEIQKILGVDWNEPPMDDFNFGSDFYSVESLRLDCITDGKDFFLNLALLKVIRDLVDRGNFQLLIKIGWELDGPDRTPFPTNEKVDIHPGAQMIVYGYLLHRFGIRALVDSIGKDRYKQVNWKFRSVCPFHRRVHTSNNWFISASAIKGYYIGCFHRSPVQKKHYNDYLCEVLPGFDD